MQQNIIKVIVGSKNPVKVNAATNAMKLLFPESQIETLSMDAPSGVPAQPMTDSDTRQGAVNRVNYCQRHTEADYYFAMEGGVDQQPLPILRLLTSNA